MSSQIGGSLVRGPYSFDALSVQCADLCRTLCTRPLQAAACLQRIETLRTTIRRTLGDQLNVVSSSSPPDDGLTNNTTTTTTMSPALPSTVLCPTALSDSVPVFLDFLIACHNYHDDHIRTLENLIANLAYLAFALLPAPLPSHLQSTVHRHFCFLCHASRLQLNHMQRGAVVVRGVPALVSLIKGDALLSPYDDYIWLAEEAWLKMDTPIISAWLSDLHRDVDSEGYITAMQQSLVETSLFAALKLYEVNFFALSKNNSGTLVFPLSALKAVIESSPARKEWRLSIGVTVHLAKLAELAAAAMLIETSASIQTLIAGLRLFSCCLHSLFHDVLGRPADSVVDESWKESCELLYKRLASLGHRLVVGAREARLPQIAPQFIRMGLMIAGIDGLGHRNFAVPQFGADMLRLARDLLCCGDILAPDALEVALTIGLTELYEHWCVARLRFRTPNSAVHAMCRACLDLLLVCKPHFFGEQRSGSSTVAGGTTRRPPSSDMSSDTTHNYSKEMERGIQNALRVASWMSERTDPSGGGGLGGQSRDNNAKTQRGDDTFAIPGVRQALWSLAAFFATQAQRQPHQGSMAPLIKPTEMGLVNDVDALDVSTLPWSDYASWADLHDFPSNATTTTTASAGVDTAANTATGARRQAAAASARFVEGRLRDVRVQGSLAASLRFFDELLHHCIEEADDCSSAAQLCENFVAILLCIDRLPAVIPGHILAGAAKLYENAKRPEDALRVGIESLGRLRSSACDLPYAGWITASLSK